MAATLDQLVSAVNSLHSDIKSLHGDIKVALDRTVNQGADIANLRAAVTDHGKDLATTKAQATFFGTLSSAVLVGLIEGAKAILGGKAPGGS